MLWLNGHSFCAIWGAPALCRGAGLAHCLVEPPYGPESIILIEITNSQIINIVLIKHST
jgi:hypothetical protein